MEHQFFIRPMEFWKKLTPEIVGFDIRDWYWISTEGRVYSSISNKILKPSIDRYGYPWVGLYINGIRKQKLCSIHRLVMLAFYPRSDSDSLQVNHINGLKIINDEFNLEWATPSENMKHAFSTGLHPSGIGENNKMASISNDMALKIGELLSTELYTFDQISEMTGCSKSIISSINTGQTWRFVYDKYDLGNKHVPSNKDVFSYYEIHEICKYFELHNIKILTLDIKKDILHMLGKECNYNTKKCISRIFHRKDHINISANYNF